MGLSNESLTSVMVIALNQFRDEFGNDLTVAGLITLLSVNRNPGINQSDLGTHIKGLSQSALSRNVLSWTRQKSETEAGPDFIEAVPDPAYRRRNVLNPTAKGLAFFDTIVVAANKVLANRKNHSG